MNTPPSLPLFAPCIEPLEARIAPTVFLVNTITDSADDLAGNPNGFLSLREAIVAANTNAAFGDAPAGEADGDRIVLMLPDSQTITLSRGQLSITDDLQISGGGATITGSGASRVLHIDAGGGPVSLSNLTIAGGNSGAGNSGGGIFITSGENVSLLQVTLSNNTAGLNGGGLFNNGSNLGIVNSTFFNNTANGSNRGEGGGGIFSSGVVVISNTAISLNKALTGSGNGGGILVSAGGVLTVFGGNITGNQAARAGGGIEVIAATTTLNDVDLGFSPNAGNSAGVNGGGLHISGAGFVTLNGGSVVNNTAGQEGGGLWNSSTGTLVIQGTAAESVWIRGNRANGNGGEQGGGGVFNDGGTVSIDQAWLYQNSATATALGNGGGGIFNDGTMFITNSEIDENTAPNGSADGGGIFNAEGGVLTVTASTITGNSAVRAGGGIENRGSVQLNETTLGGAAGDRNTAGVNGGGLHTTGAGVVTINGGVVSFNIAVSEGGGLWNSASGTLTVNGATISENRAFFGAGVFGDGLGGTIAINGSTISGNRADISGGGVATEGGVLNLTNSTVSGNFAFTSGSGGIAFGGGTGSVRSSTIAGNSGFLTGGGGITQTGGFLTLLNTIVADNMVNGAAADVARTAGTLGASYSLLESIPAGTITDVGTLVRTGIDPLLGPLADNGGLTLTHAITTASPAFNAGTATALSTDQRGAGFARRIGAQVDLGAFEIQDGVSTDSRFAISSGKTDRVLVYDTFTGGFLFAIDAFDGSRDIRKGVTVATGDVTGDGIEDIIVGAGPGAAGPHVKVFDGVSGAPLADFLAYNARFRGGVYVAAGDIDGDGVAEIITGADRGRLSEPQVKVFTGLGIETGSLTPYAGFSGGVRVATGDVNGDGFADIVTAPGKGAAPNVKVFDGTDGSLLDSFLTFDSRAKNGVFVATGDVNGDGVAEIITGLDRGKSGNEIRVFRGFGFGVPREQVTTNSFFGPRFTGGVRMATADINGDNIADLFLGTGPSTAPEITFIDPTTGRPLFGFALTDPAFKGGVFVG